MNIVDRYLDIRSEILLKIDMYIMLFLCEETISEIDGSMLYSISPKLNIPKQVVDFIIGFWFAISGVRLCDIASQISNLKTHLARGAVFIHSEEVKGLADTIDDDFFILEKDVFIEKYMVDENFYNKIAKKLK